MPERPRWQRAFGRAPRTERPRLSQSSSAELVGYLEHPNGWWRDLAQQLLVERADTGVVPRLRQLAASASDDRVRLHALWALEGIGGLDSQALVERLVTAKRPREPRRGVQFPTSTG